MSPRLILTATAIIVASAASYTVWLHSSLSRQVAHATRTDTSPANIDDGDDGLLAQTLETLPQNLRQNSSAYCVHHDVASLRVQNTELPSYPGSPDLLLTHYLRHTMSRFSRYPQAWLMRLVFRADPQASRSFDTDYIRNLHFQPGDVVNGAYVVVSRTENQVVFGMNKAQGLPGMDGRLAVGYVPAPEGTMFFSQTMQWTRKNGKVALPLESPGMKWLHELASWGLLVGGVRHLRTLRTRQEEAARG